MDGNDLFEEFLKYKQSEIKPFKLLYRFSSRHQNWIALNVFHVGQALALALKSNKSVVDINLACNGMVDPFAVGNDPGAEVWWIWVQSE